MPLSSEPFVATDALAELMSELIAKHKTCWLAKAADVTQDMIRKVARGEAGLSLDTAARLSRKLIEKKNDHSLVVLLTGEADPAEPFVNGSLDDEVLDMDSVTVEARRAFNQKDRLTVIRTVLSAEHIVRRMRAEARRLTP